jgi:hypothetical protein
MMGVAERQRKQRRTHQSASHPIYKVRCVLSPLVSLPLMLPIGYPFLGFITLPLSETEEPIGLCFRVAPESSAHRKIEPRLRIAPCVRKATHLYEMTHLPDTRKVLPCKLLPFCTLTFLLGSIP